MIATFVSRPNWNKKFFEHHLKSFDTLLDQQGFKANTIGKSHTALSTPFDEVYRLMSTCKCTIVLGLPQIFIHTGSTKDVDFTENLILPTEWNQIEATMSLMLKLPTLVLLHKNVSNRGIFEKGAANIFVHSFDFMHPDWKEGIRPSLEELKKRAEGRL